MVDVGYINLHLRVWQRRPPVKQSDTYMLYDSATRKERRNAENKKSPEDTTPIVPHGLISFSVLAVFRFFDFFLLGRLFPCLLLKLLLDLFQRVSQLVEHLIEKRVANIERRLDANGARAEQCARDEHTPFEQGRSHAIANEAIRKLHSDKQSFAPHLFEDVGI